MHRRLSDRTRRQRLVERAAGNSWPHASIPAIGLKTVTDGVRGAPTATLALAPHDCIWIERRS